MAPHTANIGKYVIRLLDVDGDLIDSFVGEAGYVDALDAAKHFSSKLSALNFIETLYADRRESLAVVRCESVVPKPKAFTAPFDLFEPDPLRAIDAVIRLHEEYCKRVATWLQYIGLPVQPDTWPRVSITATAHKWAGLYTGGTKHVCTYVLPYAMMQSDYEITVAHEVVHAFQEQFTGFAAGHGPDFYALMRHAAKQPIAAHTHSYNVLEAFRLADTLIPWFNSQKERGVLHSLPVEVCLERIKRSGVRNGDRT